MEADTIQQLISRRKTSSDEEHTSSTVNNKSKSFSELTETEQEMINYIVYQNSAFFCHQQINDPDLTDEERRSIVTKVLTSVGGKKKFLYRFGAHVREDHLNLIKNIPNEQSQDEYEITFLLNEIRRRNKNRLNDIKNRRFAAMQRMLTNDECEYFSEKEMMTRQPLLYEHLIGQYLTDTEKKMRDNFDPNVKFSNVLLNGIEQNQREELRKKQKIEETRHGGRNICVAQENIDIDDNDSDEDSLCNSDHKNEIINENYYPQIPPSFKTHWGGFEDTLPQTSAVPRFKQLLANDRKQNYITSSEKEILRQEFIGIMQSNFIAGKDSDFDYSTVDDNEQYDDIDIHDQDEQDKYFNEDSDNDDSFLEPRRRDLAESEEDELDNYMKQINK